VEGAAQAAAAAELRSRQPSEAEAVQKASAADTVEGTTGALAGSGAAEQPLQSVTGALQRTAAEGGATGGGTSMASEEVDQPAELLQLSAAAIAAPPAAAASPAPQNDTAAAAEELGASYRDTFTRTFLLGIVLPQAYTTAGALIGLASGAVSMTVSLKRQLEGALPPVVQPLLRL